MHSSKTIIGFFLLLILSCSQSEKLQHWKGYAIIGNGEVCAVYSDDDRLSKSGIQHFYYKNYTADYISSSSCKVLLENGLELSGNKIVGMANFYTASSKIESASKAFEIQVNSFPDIGLVVSLLRNEELVNSTYEYKIHLRKNIKTDKTIKLVDSNVTDTLVLLKWNNNISLILSSNNVSGSISLADSVLTLTGKLETDTTTIIIAAYENLFEKTSGELINKNSNTNYWEDWIISGVIPEFQNQLYGEYYKQNLYAAKAANLYGMIPADITGQFVTNNMPQLYPRDAMMTARVFLKTGHLEEAKQVIEFWANEEIPRKSKGEWYARYDAYGNAVDAGTGARYDEPEWDANGYFILLLDMYYKKTGEWLIDSLQIYETADFLVNKLDKNNLLFEGGIIEWSGYLPSTNMTAAAALNTASKIAHDFGNNKKSVLYKNAANKISNNLKLMFDNRRKTYADLRFAGVKNNDNSSLQSSDGDTLFLWDTSANFGILWGYPDHDEMRQTNNYYAQHTVKSNGGVQYFNAPDQGLASYGNDMFFFTTAARAQYLALNNNTNESQKHIDWMLNNSNIYGLMPERIYLNNQDCSDASPLSWCCAEFTAALMELHFSNQRKLK